MIIFGPPINFSLKMTSLCDHDIVIAKTCKIGVKWDFRHFANKFDDLNV